MARICTGGAFGSMPFGTGPLGSFMLGGLFAAQVLSPTTVRVSTAFQNNPGMLNPTYWSVSPIGLGVTVAVIGVTEVTTGVLWELTLDPGMTLGGLGYLISFDAQAADVAMLAGCTTVAIDTPPLPPVVPEPALTFADQPYDIANPQLVRDAGIVDPPPLGQYQVNDRGDFGLDNRLTGLRKRILRRISTERGGFFHLPDYGLAQPIKGPIRPSVLVSLAADARIQIEREPEVVRAQVSVVQLRGNPNVVVVAVRAQTVNGLDVTANQTLDLRGAGVRI